MGSYPLIVASERDNAEIMQLLLDSGAAIEPQGWEGDAPQTACYYGCMNAVWLLLKEGANVNGEAGLMGDALQCACFSSNLSDKMEPIIHTLLDRGAKVNATPGILGSALQGAVFSQ